MPEVGTAKTHRKNRARLRKRLAERKDPLVVEQIVSRFRERHAAARADARRWQAVSPYIGDT